METAALKQRPTSISMLLNRIYRHRLHWALQNLAIAAHSEVFSASPQRAIRFGGPRREKHTLSIGKLSLVIPACSPRLKNAAKIEVLLYCLGRFCYGLLVTRWSLVGPDLSPLFLPAV